jgi:glycosyltransferase involved in cell wall biosynthesis
MGYNPPVNISILAAGAGGMYCGSCMRDNALASALQRLGHRITLIPLFTPLRTERPDASIDQVFYGGVNVYLQHATRLFRKTPRLFDWLLDRRWLLSLAGRYGSTTPPEELGGLTLDILRGEDGPAVKELRRLLQFMKHDVRPQVVSIPNLMFIGVAPVLKKELGVPVVCELSGEDIFLDALAARDRELAQQLIRSAASDVNRFVATSTEYAGRMAEYLDVERDDIEVVYPSVPTAYLNAPARLSNGSRPPTVGYLARICPEKGLRRLVDAMLVLWQMPGMSDVRLKVAGYLGKRDLAFYEQEQARIRAAGKLAQCEFGGEVTRDGKLALIDGCDVFSTPTEYVESKGIPVLEAWSRGVPVVQPAHGSFPELIEKSGGAGLLAAPGDAKALADGMAKLLRDRGKRDEMGRLGRAAVAAHFTDERMAENMLAVYESLVGGRPEPALV